MGFISFLIIIFLSTVTIANIYHDYNSYPLIERNREIDSINPYYNSFIKPSTFLSLRPPYTKKSNYRSSTSKYNKVRQSYTTTNYYSSTYNYKRQKEKSDSSSHWSYQYQNSWSKEYLDCSGNRQSPINIDTHHTNKTRSMNILFSNEFINCCNNLNMKNNGHTVKISFKSENKVKSISNKKPWISGAALNNKKYILEDIHFHWGSRNTYGSEHTIDGNSYPLEMHYVLYKKKYSNFKKASKQSDGLVVIATFFDISSNINRDLEPLMSRISDIRCRGQSVTLKLNVFKLLPIVENGFFKYKGSLTTPPCYESVTWIVLKDVNTIERRQLFELRSLFEDECENKKMVDNFRFQQEIHSRDILQSFGRDISIEN